MKLSKSLLEEEFGEKIFEKSLNKAKDLLTEVFGLDFSNSDPKILEMLDKSTEYKYEVLFDIGGRKITAVFSFENDYEDILKEVLTIEERVVNEIVLVDKADDYSNTVKKAMDYLEEKYDIDFTPLDLEAENKNIGKIEYIKDEYWMVLFNSDNHEAEFKAECKFKEGKPAYLTITQLKHHVIYL